ncbi:MAG: FAD-binding and (Fe-S)-binding domain-containing protein, partial [Longimicrobiales bacterium]
VAAIEAELPDGNIVRFGEDRTLGAAATLGAAIENIVTREADELRRRVPAVMRHVAGYNLHRLLAPDATMAELLVGSEGTLAFFRSLTLKLQQRPKRRVLAVCHCPTLRSAMDAVQHIAPLKPHAIELIDQTMLQLARQNPSFRDTVDRFMPQGSNTVLLVEFAGGDAVQLNSNLEELEELVSGLPEGGRTIPAEDEASQQRIWGVRRASLSIAMSMKGDRKPVSFIEDCAVPLNHLAEYAGSLNEIFQRHNCSGTWYAHASVGCLHVRPALSMKDPRDVDTMGQIAAEVHDVVRRLGGSHSGEHGDGLLRSEFIEGMLGTRISNAFREVKQAFDPTGLMNPGKIVDPPVMTDRSLFRYGPDYATKSLPTVMDWSSWGGLPAAVEMCNNNGACRKFDPGVMCPSYRVTREEVDSTRGRANILRRALSGQIGPAGLRSQQVKASLDLCVGCKACRRECPTGVDMARMKAEVQYQQHGGRPPLRERLFAHLPRVAPLASRIPTLANLRNHSRGLAKVADRALGIASSRTLPTWSRNPFRDDELTTWDGSDAVNGDRHAVLFGDTFNRYFDPDVLRAGVRVLARAGVTAIRPHSQGGRPLCCGRSYISAGMLDQAKEELERTIRALHPMVQTGLPLVGLEPSCVLTLRDEAPDLVPGDETKAVAVRALLFDEFLAQSGLARPVTPTSAAPTRVHVHGHCHQKALGSNGSTAEVLETLLGSEVNGIATSCCGMAGSFGYESEHVDTSLAMGELTLFPALRAAPEADPVVANGFSCRSQIKDGTGRQPMHVASILDRFLVDS